MPESTTDPAPDPLTIAYVATSHWALEQQAEEVLATDPDAFDSLVLTARSLLGLESSYANGAEMSIATYAVVRQINYMLESSAELITLSKQDQGPRSWTAGDLDSALDPMAEQMANDLNDDTPDSYDIQRFLR